MNIEVKNLKIQYEERVVLKGLDLEIPSGKITMLIGANGCGKSTLLKSIGRILRPDSGTVYFDGTDLKHFSSKQLAKKMAMLPQNPNAPRGISVGELVAYGRYPHQKAFGGLGVRDRKIMKTAMQETGVYEFRNQELLTLSGGQRQRAWIAMALAQETDTLILDEPTTYLDLSHQLEILSLLKALNQKGGRTIVIVIHELNLASKFADCLVGMRDGRILFQGAPSRVITPDNLRELYEIDASIQMSEDGAYPICTDFELIRGVC